MMISHPIPDETITVKNGSKPVPSPKPKPRHHKNYSRTNSDLHTTSSNLHTKTTRSDSHLETTSDPDLCFRTTSDLHSKATGQSPKLKPKLLSDGDSVTDTAMNTSIIKTTSGQSEVTEVLTKPLTANTSDFQSRNVKTTSGVQLYHIDTIGDDVTDGPASPELQAKTVTMDSSTRGGSSQHTSSHTKTTSDRPIKPVSDSHPKISTDLRTIKTDDNLHTRTSDDVHTSVTLDVVSDNFVAQTDVGWGPTPEVTADGKATGELQKRLKGKLEGTN